MRIDGAGVCGASDGMEYGLDFKKNDANERTVDVNGKYTNIEMYMNSLVHGIMEAGSKGGAVAD